MKVISILGSTGSIGSNTLKVTASFPGHFRVAGLSAGRNIPVLAKQVEDQSPQVVSTDSERSSFELQSLLRQRGYPMNQTRFVHGVDGSTEVSCHPDISIVLSAITGAAGLLPTFRALEEGKTIALANKETMVVAGSLMMSKAREKQVEIIPVDSEHNAIHQCLRGGSRSEVRRLILTASGGPFLNTPREKLREVTRDEALNHPTWKMGRKITIDSATLMNKGLEVIEASTLFGFAADLVEVAIHPQSVVHSMVEFIDGSVLAQMGRTDMRLPIQYALTYPERWISPLPPLEIHKLSALEFHAPDREKFQCLDLAYTALRSGGTAPAVLNAANEVAVEQFLNDGIAFHEIPDIIRTVLDGHTHREADSIESLLEADTWARREAAALARGVQKTSD